MRPTGWPRSGMTSRYRNRRILFSWPSAGDPRGYIYDRDSVLFARDGFEQLIRDLRARGQRKIFIMAHSMGGYLTMEALRQMALKGDRQVMDAISAVVLMSPDIDPDVFRQQAETIGRLPQPFVIMTSRKDRVLSAAELLTGRKPRLGRIESAEAVAGLDVSVLDLTGFDDGSAGGHMVAASSASAIQLLRGARCPDPEWRQWRSARFHPFGQGTARRKVAAIGQHRRRMRGLPGRVAGR